MSKRLKIKIYSYSIVLPNFFGYQYLKLTGKKLDFAIIKKIALISAIMPLEDEMVDNGSYSNEKLYKFFYQYNHMLPENYIEKLYKDIGAELLESFNEVDRNEFFKYLEKIHKAQIESRKQKKHDLGTQELKKIIADKGGNAIILYAKAINSNLSVKEEKALYEVGFWIQLLDDLNDIKKDLKEGIRTLVNGSNSLDSYIDSVEEQRMKAFSEVKKLPYSEKNKRNYLFRNFYFSKLLMAFYGNRKKELSNIALYEVFRVLLSLRHAFKEIMKFEY